MKKLAVLVLVMAVVTLALAIVSRYSGAILPLAKNGVAPRTLISVTNTFLLFSIALALIKEK